MNRVTADTRARLPIIQSPMAWIARAKLASAVSNAGGLGMIETSSGEFDAIKAELKLMHRLTDQPFGVNLALLYLQNDDSIIDHIIGEGVRFVTTSAGDPFKYIDRLKNAGLTVYHSVPSLAGALKAAKAGVDGLIVEGAESGAVRNPKEIGTIVLLQLVRAQVDLPIVAAGGIADGRGMAAAFVLGAEGVQMGTRFVASLESPVHEKYKNAILAAGDTGTIVVNRGGKPCMRVLRTAFSESLESGGGDFKEIFGRTRQAYFEGNLDVGVVSAGQSSALIDRVETAATIIEDTMSGFYQATAEMAKFIRQQAP